VEEILLFNKFFRLSIHASVVKIQPDKVLRQCLDGKFLRPVFSASRVQHISDLHSKFALRRHHVWKNFRRLRIGEKKKEKEEETTGQKYNGQPYSVGRGPV